MLNKTIAVLAVAMTAGTCFPQAPPAEQAKYFRLDFVIKELEEGKTINARHYLMIVQSSQGGAIRTGDKVPVRTSSGDSKYTYLDVGVNIDCRNVKQSQEKLELYVIVDISSVASEAASLTAPLIRNTKWSSNVILPLGKSTVLFTSDETTSKRQMQLELTATPV
jgi:hypothetical protein